MAIINPAELDLQEEAVVKINRTAKVTSRGKRFRFSALIVVGDGKGHIGVGLGKANEVISAINKGKDIAKRNIVKVSIVNGTVPHQIIGKHGASRIMLKPASPGTGIIAGASVCNRDLGDPRRPRDRTTRGESRSRLPGDRAMDSSGTPRCA